MRRQHPALHSARKGRRGFSLLEAAIVVTILSVVVVLSSTTLVALFRVERQFAGDGTQDFAINRLASQFRADLHAAASASIADGCELSLADGRTIHYDFAAPAVTREVRRGNNIEQREAFVLARGTEARFAQDEQQPRLIRIEIAAAGQPRPASSLPVHELTIEAAVNLRPQLAAGGSP